MTTGTILSVVRPKIPTHIGQQCRLDLVLAWTYEAAALTTILFHTMEKRVPRLSICLFGGSAGSGGGGNTPLEEEVGKWEKEMGVVAVAMLPAKGPWTAGGLQGERGCGYLSRGAIDVSI